MSAPIAPNTTAVLVELQAQMQALTLADGITLAYNTVKIGGIKDYTVLPLPVCAIIPHQDDSKRHDLGGGIKEITDIEFRSVVDDTVSDTAELQIVSIRDALMPLLNKFAVTPNTQTVYHAAIKANSAMYAWMFLKPNWYRIHTVTLEVAQYYVIPGGIQ